MHAPTTMRWLSWLALLATLVAGCGDDGGRSTPIPTPTASPTRAGDLDRPFGMDGFVVTDFQARGDVANAVVVQPDGKVVAVGGSDPPDGQSAFAAARYGANGTLDASFGENGRVLSPLGGFTEATAVVLAGDGKIVVAGSVARDDALRWGIVRYTADGRPDPTFGNAGVVLTQVGLGGRLSGVALQADGKLVATGAAFVDGNDRFALARYQPDGTLDPTFGTDGIVTTRIDASSDPSTLVLQPDGDIVVAGSATNLMDGTLRFALARYLPDGTLDATFGLDGVVVTDVTPGSSSTITALAPHPDGAIVAAGPGGFDQTDRAPVGPLLVARYRRDGGLDESFGTHGIVTTDFIVERNFLGETLLRPDGAVIIAYATLADGDVFSRAAVARLTATGALDPEFGTAGVFAMHVRPDDESAFRAVAIQSDGEVVVAGFSRADIGTGNYDFALARLH